MEYNIYMAIDDKKKMIFILEKLNSCRDKTLDPFDTLINDRADLDKFNDLNWSDLERPEVPGVYEVIVEYKENPDDSETDYSLNVISCKATLIFKIEKEYN